MRCERIGAYLDELIALRRAADCASAFTIEQDVSVFMRVGKATPQNMMTPVRH
jgi:hypothetical protein